MNNRKKYNFVKVDIKIPIKVMIDGYAQEYEINISDLLFAVLQDKNKVREAIGQIRPLEKNNQHKYNF